MKYHITSISSVLQDFADCFSISLVFHMFFTLVLVEIKIEWNMKVKGQILICTAIMLNDHSNPYIESTTVLSDTCTLNLALVHVSIVERLQFFVNK